MANVLIVDDSILIRNKLKTIMINLGHQVVAEAESGVQAVRRYREYCPDFLTMDITMPEMDGITALKKILEIDRNAKVIMLSAMSQKLLVLEALKSGAKHFIVKPIDEVKLKQVIDEVIEQKPAEKLLVSQKEEKLSGNDNEKEAVQISGESAKSIVYENIDGVVLVKVLKEPSEEELGMFMLTMNGILNISRIHVMFDFEEVNELGEDFCRKIDVILERISASKGEYIVASINDRLKACVRSYKLKYFLSP